MKCGRVDYNPERVKLVLDREKELYGLDQHFIHTLIYTKAHEWAYEHEWRVIARLEHQDPVTGHHFLDFGPKLTLREVILGCRNDTPVGAIAKLVHDNEASVRVCRARPAFQEFAMVENKRIKALNVHPR